MTAVGRLRVRAGDRPIDVTAGEDGIDVHVPRPFTTARAIRAASRAVGHHAGLRRALDRVAEHPVPVRVRLSRLPPIRLHPDPGPIGRWLRRRSGFGD